VSVNGNGGFVLAVVDLHGRTIRLERGAGSRDYDLRSFGLSKGIYSVRVTTAAGSVVRVVPVF